MSDAVDQMRPTALEEFSETSERENGKETQNRKERRNRDVCMCVCVRER